MLTTSEPYQTIRKWQRGKESLDEHLERRYGDVSFVREIGTARRVDLDVWLKWVILRSVSLIGAQNQLRPADTQMAWLQIHVFVMRRRGIWLYSPCSDRLIVCWEKPKAPRQQGVVRWGQIYLRWDHEWVIVGTLGGRVDGEDTGGQNERGGTVLVIEVVYIQIGPPIRVEARS